MLLWLPSGGRGSLPFYPWPQDLFAVGGAGMSSRSTAWWWELPQAGVWPVVLLEIGFPSSSLIVVVQLGPVVLWESCCSHLLVVNWFFFPVVAVSRAGEKHLKEASFHLGWIWLVQAHFQFLLGQEITFWQPDSAGSCGCGYDHCAQVVHWWWYIFIFHPVQGIDRYWILFCPSAQRTLWAENSSVASSLLEF